MLSSRRDATMRDAAAHERRVARGGSSVPRRWVTSLRTRRGPGFRRSLTVALAVLLGLYALYLVAANAILGSGLAARWMSAQPDALEVEYDTAWTAYPGQLVVHGLSLRLQDYNVQARLTVDRASIRFYPFALLSRTLHAKRVRADGVRFSLRHKLAKIEGNEERARAYPPVPGFADPPLRVGPEPPPIPDELYDLWEVRADDVAATAEELWIMEYRFVGTAKVTGAFRLRPMRELSVAPSELHADGGVVTMSGHELLRVATLDVAATVEPFDVRVPVGLEVLRHVRARVALDGEVVSLKPASAMYLGGAGVSLEQGRGHLTADVRADLGVLAEDTGVTYRSDHVVAQVGPATASGHVEASARRDAAREQVHGRIAITDAEVHGAAERLLVAPEARAAGALDGVDLTRPFTLASASVALEPSTARDLRAASAFLRAAGVSLPMDLAGGSAVIAARGEIARGRALGRVDVTLDRAQATSPSVSLTTSGKVWFDLASRAPGRALGLAGSGAALHDLSVRVADRRARGLYASAKVTESTLSLAPEASFEGGALVRVGPGDRVLGLAADMAPLPAPADLALGAAAGEALGASLALDVSDAGVSLRVREAEDGAVEVTGGLRAPSDGPSRGAFVVTLGFFRAGLELRDGDVDVTPFVGHDWLASHAP